MTTPFNTQKPRILVTSAGGHTGRPAVRQLLAQGYPVRALMRRDDARARLLKEAGAEIFLGDQLDLRDLRRALQGVQRAYYCPPFAPNLLHGASLFALAAEEAKLEVVAYLGAWNPHAGHPAIHQREQWIAGSLMQWMPSVDVIHVNPGVFAFTYFLGLPFVAQFGLLALPYGDGLNAPPSNEDIARVVTSALADPAAHIGKFYRPTGPRLLSPQDAAEAMTRAFGRKVRYQNASENLFLKAALAQGFPIWQVSQVRRYAIELQEGVYAVGAPTDHVRVVTGQEPEDFETIARRYAASPEAQRTTSNKLRALRLMAKMMVTRVPDLDRWERTYGGYPLIENGELAHESEEWRKTAERVLPNLWRPA